jgi:hypothetical protein
MTHVASTHLPNCRTLVGNVRLIIVNHAIRPRLTVEAMLWQSLSNKYICAGPARRTIAERIFEFSCFRPPNCSFMQPFSGVYVQLNIRIMPNCKPNHATVYATLNHGQVKGRDNRAYPHHKLLVPSFNFRRQASGLIMHTLVSK